MPHRPEQPNTSPQEAEPFARPPRFLKFFIASFEHSQGYQVVQYDIFRYLHASDPSLVISPAEREALITASTKAILHLLGIEPHRELPSFPHKHLTEVSVLRTVAPVASHFSRLLNSSVVETTSILVPRLTKSLINRDYRFLVELKTRTARQERASETSTAHRLADPHFSYVCAYGLQGKKTGIAELDGMYQDVASQCHALLDERVHKPFVSRTTERLERVIAAYNRHHPENRIEFVGDTMA